LSRWLAAACTSREVHASRESGHATSTAGHSTGHATGHTSRHIGHGARVFLVNFHHYWVENVFKSLELFVELLSFSALVSFEPLCGLFDFMLDRGFFFRFEFVLEFLILE
jgi:hypothetical protein